jgi:hypothetical protein
MYVRSSHVRGAPTHERVVVLQLQIGAVLRALSPGYEALFFIATFVRVIDASTVAIGVLRFESCYDGFRVCKLSTGRRKLVRIPHPSAIDASQQL